jgi:uncharacterized repeat protein (TIGR01451 family)
VASVSGGNQVNTGNDSSSDPTAVTSVADIHLAKTASSGSVPVGSTVTYTVTASNAGPSDATGVQVTDLPPAGLSFVSATPATGTYTAGSGVWNVGSLASGASTTMTLTATVTATGTITNTASKSAESESDPNLSNDSGSASITGQPAPGLPGPPNGGMAPVIPSTSGGGQGGGLFVGAALAAFFGLLFLRRRSQRLAIAAAVMAFASLTTMVTPGTPVSPSAISGGGSGRGPTSALELFGKPISTVKPQIGVLATTLHPATGSITPYRLRIPALDIDTMVESVGVTRRGLMDVPANIWDAAWLKSGVKPGASGQAVIDGHLDSTQGSAVFSDLHRLHPGDRFYVSDASGSELTFRVATLQVEPLDGFPVVRVFGPSHGRLLNLITCAGTFVPARKTYDHRLVVFAELV